MDAVVLERANHLETGAVADVSQARITMSAEVPLKDSAVFCAVEKRAPRFKFAYALWGFLRVKLRHAPVVKVLAATHRIGEVDAPVVAIIDIAERTGHPALGHNGVRFAQQRFAYHSPFRPRCCGFDGRTQACAARSDHQDIVREP